MWLNDSPFMPIRDNRECVSHVTEMFVTLLIVVISDSEVLKASAYTERFISFQDRYSIGGWLLTLCRTTEPPDNLTTSPPTNATVHHCYVLGRWDDTRRLNTRYILIDYTDKK